MADEQAKIGILIEAQDKATAAVRRFAQSTEQSLDKLGKEISEEDQILNRFRADLDRAAQAMKKVQQGQDALAARTAEASKKWQQFAMGLTAGVVAAAVYEMKRALEALAKSLAESLPDLTKWDAEVTTLNSSLNSLRFTMQDPEFQNLTLVEKAAAGALALVATSAADADAAVAKLNRQSAERELRSRVAMTLAKQENDAEYAGLQTVNMLGEARKKWAADAAKQHAEAKKQHEENRRGYEEYTALENARYAKLRETRAKMRQLEADYQQGIASLKADWVQQELEMAAKVEEDKLASQRRAYDQTVVLYQGMGAAFTAFSTTLIDESDKGATAIIKATVRAGRIAIETYIAQGMAAAAAANAGIPGFGWVAAGIAAGIMGALLESFLAKLPKAAFGGVINAGQTSGDRTAILTNRGEGVLRSGQTSVLQQLADAVTALVNRPATASAGGGGSLTFAPTISMLDVGTLEQQKKLLISLGRAASELHADGLFLPELRRV